MLDHLLREMRLLLEMLERAFANYGPHSRRHKADQLRLFHGVVFLRLSQQILPGRLGDVETRSITERIGSADRITIHANTLPDSTRLGPAISHGQRDRAFGLAGLY